MAAISQSARSKRPTLAKATYSAANTFGLFGVAYGTGMEAVKTGRFPVEPIRVGRQLRFPKAKVDALLGITGDPALIDSEDSAA